MRLQNEAPRYIGGFLSVMGIAFIVAGALEEEPLLTNLLWGAGGLFLLFGALAYWIWRRHMRGIR